MRKLALGWILFLALAGSGYTLWASLLEPLVASPSPQIGKMAPGFSLIDASGGSVSLAQFRWASPVVLLFANSYQSPALDDQLQELHARERVLAILKAEVIVVTSDEPQALPPRLQALGPLFHLLFDPAQEVAIAFEVEAEGQMLPAAFVIDSQGKVRFRHVGSGPQDVADMKAIIGVVGGL